MITCFQVCPIRAEEPAPAGAGVLFYRGDGRPAARATAFQQPPQKEPKEKLGEEDLPDELRALEQALERPATTTTAPALQQEVTTVTGQTSTVGKSPAAVFVVTEEMIRRSGARSIPEVLRLVPGLQVARVSSNQWAITSRGFNTNIAGLFATNNKLLVLIDGRTVFSPFFNGTYWDVQDVVLDDIDRIEVIRGPGATIWGANAVNGVINIITKRASETQGGLVKAGGGTEERGFAAASVGGRLAENLHYRVYGKWSDRDASFNTAGPEFDDWRQGRGGFRMDWTPNCCDLVTLQGDIYEGRNGILNLNTNLPDKEQVRGGNVLARWTRTFSEDSDLSLQFYYDRADRKNNVGFLDQQINTYDTELRYHFRPHCWHNVIWGIGYRSVRDQVTPTTAPPAVQILLNPQQRTFDTFSTFMQDEITLLDDELFLTLGAKLLDNDFTGFEIQPSARMLWAPEDSWAAWAAVSRAVRTPSRVEHDMRIPIGGVDAIALSRNFRSEALLAYEAGCRAQPVEWFSWDLAVFFNQYENLATFENTPPVPPGFPIFNSNANRGEGYGFELTANVEMTECWRIYASYSFLQLQIHPGPGVLQNGEEVEGSSPHNQVFLMSTMDLTDNLDFDVMGRYVDNLPFQNVRSYISLDTRLGWRPNCCWELSVVGQNLLDSQRAEFGDTHQIQRGVYGMATRTW